MKLRRLMEYQLHKLNVVPELGLTTAMRTVFRIETHKEWSPPSTTYPIGARHRVWGIGGLRIFRCILGGLWAGGGNLEWWREKQTRMWTTES